MPVIGVVVVMRPFISKHHRAPGTTPATDGHRAGST
jgi:hypothetical protein